MHIYFCIYSHTKDTNICEISCVYEVNFWFYVFLLLPKGLVGLIRQISLGNADTLDFLQICGKTGSVDSDYSTWEQLTVIKIKVKFQLYLNTNDL